MRALGFDLGLVRTRSKRRFDYDRWVRPGAVHRLCAPDRRERYVEDPIFVRVHQVCEGILEALLVELNKVEAALFEADYAAAERHVLMASRFMKPFERTVSQLGEMSQLDYAPLRVALRDASGIQSARAQARKEVVQDHFWLFRQQLKRRGLDCFVVLANHVELAREYRLRRSRPSARPSTSRCRTTLTSSRTLSGRRSSAPSVSASCRWARSPPCPCFATWRRPSTG